MAKNYLKRCRIAKDAYFLCEIDAAEDGDNRFLTGSINNAICVHAHAQKLAQNGFICFPIVGIFDSCYKPGLPNQNGVVRIVARHLAFAVSVHTQ